MAHNGCNLNYKLVVIKLEENFGNISLDINSLQDMFFAHKINFIFNNTI